ncbi:abortive infection system toxin AbiGii family protein [Streptococcus parasuis]|uniref:abortive infection system toxin AbiGii family protein n=1 Tax=Streptococcus parasuis TaxID=1501662 RepID=UPI0028B10DAB|nr:abortive infection system toxin AbiGii family protein [Streptococcus parasuis]
MTISKFDSVFSKNNNKEVKAPTALRKKLNLSAPRGYSYELMEGTKDMYVLRSKKSRQENSFQVRIKFPLEFEGMTIHSIDELVEAMYRTQKVFKLDESLQENPSTIIHLGSTGITKQMIGSAEKFPTLEPLEIEMEEEKFLLPVERVPYPSLTKIKIVSRRDQLIDLGIILDERSNNIKMIVKLNYEHLITLDDYFKNLGIIRPFFTTGIKIFNKILVPDDNQIEVFKHNHIFFEALREIEKIFSVTFDFPHKINNDDVYFTKILFESFINNRLVAIKNKNQIAFTFDKEKFDASGHPELEDGVEIGVVNTREIISLELFGVKLQFLEYTIYPRMTFKQMIDENQEEIKMIFDLPEESEYYVLFSLDSINDFDITTTGQDLFELTDNAVSIQDIDFSKSVSR